MKETKSVRKLVYENRKTIALALIIISLLALPVAGQTLESTFTEDFEDGTAEGWSGQNTGVVSDSYNDTYSFRQNDGYGEGDISATWESGPLLDLSSEFRVQATTYADGGSGTQRQTRVGLINDNDQGAMLVFSYSNGVTVLSDDGTNYDTSSDPTLSNDFDSTWIKWELYSPGNGTLQAKVWPAGSTEPTDYQLSRDFDQSTVSPFGMVAGSASSNGRFIQVDEVTITGTQVAESENLRIESSSLVTPGETKPVDGVIYIDENGNTENVLETDRENVTLQSQDPTILQINDQDELTLTATSDENVSTRVTIQAQYTKTTGPALKEITVATVDIENLDVLPTFYRISATLTDSTIYWFIITAMSGVVATRFSSAFGGLAIMEMSVVIGWLAGYISTGLAMVSVFFCIFIGLNLALNINYALR